MKILYSLLLLPTLVASQTTKADTIPVCYRDTVCFVNWQYDNCTPVECGHIVTLVDSNSVKYETIPSNYVFDPQYQSPYTEERFCVHFTNAGGVKVRFTDYDFASGIVKVVEKTFLVGSCRDTIVSGTNDTIIVVWPVKNSERRFRNVYLPSAFNPNYSPFFPFTESHYEVMIKSLMVCDVSGNIVFEGKDFWTNDPGSGWQATTAPAGVYFWEIQTLTYKRAGAVVLSR